VLYQLIDENRQGDNQRGLPPNLLFSLCNRGLPEAGVSTAETSSAEKKGFA